MNFRTHLTEKQSWLKKKRDFLLTSHIRLCQCAAISIPAISVPAYSGRATLRDEGVLLVGKPGGGLDSVRVAGPDLKLVCQESDTCVVPMVSK